MISKHIDSFFHFVLPVMVLVLFIIPLNAAQIDFLPVGNMKKYGTGVYGNIYKAGVNDIRNHRSQDKINALFIKLYKNKKERKKENTRYTIIEFVVQLSPYVKDYDAFKGDFNHPFCNLAFGFHKNILTPTDYNGVDLLISYPLYDYPYSLRKGGGVETIFKLDTQKQFSFTNDYISYQRNSIRYAPVKISILLDEQEGECRFYLNGVLQNEISFGEKQYSPGTFILLWEKENSRKAKRTFEISAAKINRSQTPPDIRTEVPLMNWFNETDFGQAMNLLYSRQNQWETGFRKMRQLAEKGHALAMFELACCYIRGIGCSKNRQLALKWLEKAAENDVLEASSLWLKMNGLFPLTKDLEQRFVREKYFNHRNDGRLLFLHKDIVKITNPIVYAESIVLSLPHTTENQKKKLLLELKKIAESGYPFAMRLYAKNTNKDQAAWLKKAAEAGDPIALFDLLYDKKIQWTDLPIEIQVYLAGKYPLKYAGIKVPSNYDKTILYLRGELYSKKTFDNRIAFALSEYLLIPYSKISDPVRMESENLMKKAAQNSHIAQIKYIQNYLSGLYGTQADAILFMKKLLKIYKENMLIQELKLQILEKQSPGKWKKEWELLRRKKSVTALYYLGKYAAEEGNQTLAAKYRYQFLELDNEFRIKKGDGIYWGFPGQYFSGTITDFIE